MLKKNVIKTFSKKWLLILLIGIIIFLSSFMYTIMHYSIESIKDSTFKYLDDYKQEDFSINIFDSLTEEEKHKTNSNASNLLELKQYDVELFNNVVESRKESFENIYSDYSLELRDIKYVNYNFGNEHHSARVIKDSEEINLTYVEEGNKPKDNNEIAILRIYAEKNDLDIGDTLEIYNKEYLITGFVLFPDFVLPMEDGLFIIDYSKQNIALFTDEEYENIQGKEAVYFAGIANAEFDENEFKKTVINDYQDHSELGYISSITTTSNQMRSGAIYDELNGGSAMTITLSVIITSIAIVIVGIMLNKIINEQRGQLGVLKALGYSKKEIVLPYLTVIAVIVLPFLLPGYILGYHYSYLMRKLYLEFYLILSEPVTHQLFAIVTSILLPCVVFIVLCYFVIKKLLSKKPLDLLTQSVDSKTGKLNNYVNKLLKNSNSQTKFKYTFIFRNMKKFYLFFFTIVFSSFLILMAFSMSNIFDRLIYKYFDSMNYKYQTYVDPTKVDNITLPDDAEKFLQFSEAMYQDDKISITGLEPNGELKPLVSSKGKDITDSLEDGAIISSSMNLKYNIDKGDEIEVEILNKDYSFEVVDINEEYMSYNIYIDIKNLSNILSSNTNETLYSGIFTKEKVDSSEYLYVLNKNSLLDQSKMMNDFAQIAVYIMTLSAMGIGIIVILVLSVLTISENYYSISLLKVMGHNKKEINNMVLKGYLIYSIMGYIVSIPLTLISLKLITAYLINGFNVVFPLNFEWWHLLAGLLIIFVMFYMGIYIAKKHIDKISLQEVLKMYRE